jgi:hypothetical protein
MKPLEIVSALPQWKNLTPDEIVASPAFAATCRLGEETRTLRRADIAPAVSQMLSLSISFGDEPHTLSIARSPRFPELDKLWDSLPEVPGAIVLSLVERECGPLLQMLENAIRRQLKIVGLAPSAPDPDALLAFQADDLTFAVTRSATITGALGVLRNLDLASDAVRSVLLPAQAEYAAFALSDADLASLAPGDALLLPEIGTIAPRVVVDGRFAAVSGGVEAFADDGRVRVFASDTASVTLGELLDGTLSAPVPAENAQLKLVRQGKLVAEGRLGRVGDQFAFVVETKE